MTGQVRGAMLAASCMLLAGCASSPQERFYSLVVPQSDGPRASPPKYQVLLGPVTLPEIVVRPQLVVRETDVRVRISETHRWAEPLQTAIPRAIAAYLARRLPAALVEVAGSGHAPPAYTVSIDIQRFEAQLGEAARIEAAWRITGPSGAVLHGSSATTQPARTMGYDGVVEAYGSALDAISADIATMLESAVSAER